MFDAVIDALLTKSDRAPKPESGKCKMNYRFYQNTCWFDHFNEMFNYRTIRQCSDEFNCCFRLYKVCASSSTPTVYTSQQIGTSIPVDVDKCDNYVNPFPCYFLCGEPMQNSIQIIEEINEYNFEVYKNQDNLILNTDKNINSNLILEIYDFNGKLIKTEIILDKNFNYHLENINHLKYIFVTIKDNERVIYNGKFIK